MVAGVDDLGCHHDSDAVIGGMRRRRRHHLGDIEPHTVEQPHPLVELVALVEAPVLLRLLGVAELAVDQLEVVVGRDILRVQCGRTPQFRQPLVGVSARDEHIAEIDRMLRRVAGNKLRPKPKARTPQWVPSVASLYQQVPLRQENAFFAIGRAGESW